MKTAYEYWNHDGSLLTTEQAIEMASNLSGKSDIEFTTRVTDFLAIAVETGNKPDERVSVRLHVGNMSTPESITFCEEEDYYNLTLQDVAELFKLSNDPIWQVTGHGTYLSKDEIDQDHLNHLLSGGDLPDKPT